MMNRPFERVAILALVFTGVARAADQPATDDIKSIEEARTQRYADQLEDWLRDWLVNQYPQRAAKAWQRDYSCVEAFLASVEPNHRRWKTVLNPPDLKATWTS